jgi:hypothetical protein
MILISGSSAASQDLRVPERLWVCEGRDNGSCGTWSFTGSDGTGRWNNGAVADLVVQQFDSAWIIVRRSDPAGASPGLTAIYRGKLTGDRIEGTVTWTWLGHWNKQVEGTWYATMQEPALGRPAPEPPGGAPPIDQGTLPQPPQGSPASAGDSAPPGVPLVMHWCALHCMTLVWKGDHYTIATEPGNSVWTVESFTAESVILHRADLRPFPGKAVLSARISPQGNTIVDGTITWTYHPCCGLGSGTFNAAWGAALDTVPGSDRERARRLQPSAEVQAKVCGGRRIQVAMQSIEDRAIHDPSGWALRFLAGAFMGVDAWSEAASIVDSQVAVDDAGWAVDDPGSFICAGRFVHGDVHIDVSPDADAAAGLSAVAVQALMASHPPFIEWFRVKALQNGRYKITLVPTGLKLALEYSTEFTIPAR